MTPSARVQAAIEILDLVIAAAGSGGAPADRIVSEWFRTRRFAGSRDRRAVRDLVYTAIRCCGEVPASGRAAMLRLAESDSSLSLLFDGSSYGPEPVKPGENAGPRGLLAPQQAHLLGGVPKAEMAAQAGLFAAHGFDPMHLLVERDGALVGIVSARDLLGVYATDADQV